jgi:hypothetical protein
MSLKQKAVLFYPLKCSLKELQRLCKMLAKLTLGVNFINILWAAFTPVVVRQSYRQHKAYVERTSWVYFLAVGNCKVRHIFVGETDQRWRVTISALALCAKMLVKLTLDLSAAITEFFFFFPLTSLFLSSQSLKYFLLIFNDLNGRVVAQRSLDRKSNQFFFHSRKEKSWHNFWLTTFPN